MLETRRSLLKGAAAAAALAALPAAAQTPAAGVPAAPRAPFLRSDIGALRRVLVHSCLPLDGPITRIDEDLLPYAEADLEAAAAQQAELMALLRAQGAQLIEVVDALDAAIAATRASGVLAAWVEAAFPRLGADPARVTAAMLLGRDPALHYPLGADGAYRHVTDYTGSTMWTRDSAFMTPRGLVMCNAVWPGRQRENRLLRFLYAHSPLLAGYPVLFDALEEGLHIEGGDAIVVDAHTLLLGVGRITDPRIAPVLARRLDMDVLAVRKLDADYVRAIHPGDERPPASALSLLLLHLDTSMTLVAPRHVLAVPYLFEADYAETSPLARFVRGARAETLLSEEDAEAALAMLKDFGRVRLFKRGSGAEEALGEGKLVDHLRARGYRFTWVGGPRPAGDAEAFRHYMNITYPEHRRQAANVVQALPGQVIAYAGNPATKAALEADGIGVRTFAGRELWQWHGGPHCLTQPLERG